MATLSKTKLMDIAYAGFSVASIEAINTHLGSMVNALAKGQFHVASAYAQSITKHADKLYSQTIRARREHAPKAMELTVVKLIDAGQTSEQLTPAQRMQEIAEYLVKFGVKASVYEPNGPVTCVKVVDDTCEEVQTWLFGNSDDTWIASLDHEDFELANDESLVTKCPSNEPDMFKVAQAIYQAINPNAGIR